MKYLNFFGAKIACTDKKILLRDIENLQKKQTASCVTFTNVHVVISSMRDEVLRKALNTSERVAPDGMPLVWAGKLFCKSQIERCSGPDIMEALLKQTELKGNSHYFYGSTQDTLSRLQLKLQEKYPSLIIKGMYSPPFRAISIEEDEAIIHEINELNPDYIWIGLGAPKQEVWMYEHKSCLNRGVLLGVGAAFDFLAGSKKRAPLWMQRIGLEWLYRLLQEPRRLGRRYLVTNVLFILELLIKGVQTEEHE